MKVSINWLKEFVKLNVSMNEVIRLLPLRTIGFKDVTPDFFELDMKGYNRPDLLSMRGVAQEISAITDSKTSFSEPEENEYIWEKSFDKLRTSLPKTDILVENKELCPTYCLAKIEGLKTEKSSPEWIKKLSDCGMRSVNNIADVTNLVMLEYGQPLHAFDAETVSKGKIIVRTATEGEKIVTLDNKSRDLETSDLLITDPEKALGIAGVMGGKNSEVSDSTTTIFLETAIFDPINLRKTANKLGLQSEASKRFQHGLTKKRCLQALDSAIKMYQDLGGKLTAISITGQTEDVEKTITLRKSQMDSLIGIEIPEEEVENYLKKLNFKVSTEPAGSYQGQALVGVPRPGLGKKWQVVPPYWRLDIEIEADVIEEIVRMYGYEKLPSKELAGKLPEKIDQSLFKLINDVKENLVEIGLNEVQTYSFYSTDVIENCKLKISEACDSEIFENLIKILNPMSSETEYLRTHLWPNLVEVIAKNIKQGFKDIAIFEIGKTYQLTKSNSTQEEYKLCIALLNNSDNPSKELYQILNNIDIFKKKIFLGDQIGDSDGRFHPNRYHYLTDGSKPIGKLGEVHPRITDKFRINQRVAIISIALDNKNIMSNA